MSAAGTTVALCVPALLAGSAGLVVLAKPQLVTKGQDAAGQGMYGGFVGLSLLLLAALLAVADAVVVLANRASLPWWARICGLLPAAAGLLLLAGAFAGTARSRARNRAASYAALIAEPAGLIVETDDATFLALYNALRPVIGDIELSCRAPLALVWQEREWLPRARVLFVSGDDLAAPEGRELLDLLRRRKAACPIVLHCREHSALEGSQPALTDAGWEVRAVSAGGPDWVEARWLPVARELMERELARRP